MSPMDVSIPPFPAQEAHSLLPNTKHTSPDGHTFGEGRIRLEL